MTSERDRPIPSPLEQGLTMQAFAMEVAGDTIWETAVLPDRLEAALTAEVGQTPSEVVYTENKLELLHYDPLTERQHDVPVLIVYALINRPYILDLQHNRSVVRRLLEAGHDVYLVDWNEPSRLDQHLTLDDYVNRYIDNCVENVCERSGQSRINFLGYCMGGTMAVIYTALHGERVNALGLMAPGLYFEDTGGVLELWGDSDYYDPRDVTETYGNVPGEFLDAGFAMMDPVDNYLTKYVGFLERLENEDFTANFARMERWLAESVDLAGEAYVEFLDAIYQHNRLYENDLSVGGEHVDVTAIEVPMLQILGEYDHLVPPAASKPFNDVVGSADVTTIEYPTGHVGMAMSRAAHRDVWPEVAEWFLDQSEHPTFADVIADGVEAALDIDIETDVTVGDADELELSLADEDGLIRRALVTQDPSAVERFFEETLGVDIGVDVGDHDVAVVVTTDDGVQTRIVERPGEAIRLEIEEAIQDVDIATPNDLTDISGIGPTYADRLRSAGIDSVSALAVAEARTVATAAQTSHKMATEWIQRARSLDA